MDVWVWVSKELSTMKILSSAWQSGVLVILTQKYTQKNTEKERFIIIKCSSKCSHCPMHTQQEWEGKVINSWRENEWQLKNKIDFPLKPVHS